MRKLWSPSSINTSMSKEHQETLLQTIRARLEWNEKGNIEAIFDTNGDFEICERTGGKLIRYFTPALATGLDVYGNEESDTPS